LFRLHPELVGQNAFGHYAGIVTIEPEFADAPACQIFRPPDSFFLVDIDGGVAKTTDKEDGDGQKRRIAACERAQKIGQA
jgi:hypothetical protein